MSSEILPPNWSWVKLGDVVKGTQGVQIPKSKQVSDPRSNFQRYLYISDFKNDNNLKFVEDIYPSKNVTEKDLIMVNTGATAGQVLTGKTGVLSNNLFKISYSENLLREFLLWFLRSPFFYGRVSVELKGAANEHMGHEKFYNYFITLPPLPEQKKIVEKIEELFSGLDSGVASLKKAKVQIRLYRQSVLSAAFSGRLTQSAERQAQSELPKGWKWVKLGEVSEVMNGYAFKSGSFQLEGKYQVIKIGNLRPGIIRLNEKPAFIDELEEQIVKRSLLKKDDLIISLTGTRKKRDYGYVAMVTNQKNLLLNQRLAIIRLNKEYSSKYFLYLLRMNLFLDQFFRNETGNVGQGNVGINGIRESILPVPSLSQQTKIVEEIEKRFSEADNLEKAIDDSLAKSETLRQSILKQAFEGKLV